MKRTASTPLYRSKSKIIRRTATFSGLTQDQKRQVLQIAKRLDERQKENKKYWSRGSLINNSSPVSVALLPNVVQCINPFYPITQGTADYNRLGDSIIPKSVHLNLLMESNWSSGINTVNSTIEVRVIAFWSSSQLACYSAGVPVFSSWISANPAQNMFLGGDSFPTKALPDYDNITPVYDKIHIIPQNQSPTTANTQVQRIQRKIKIPIKPVKHQYQDGSSATGNGGYFKDKNLYIAVMSDSPYASSTDTLCNVEARWLTVFTDA